MATKPIIVAEHDEDTRRRYAGIVKASGFEVVQALDGQIALSLLHKHSNLHLIFLAVVMPHIDGIEACKRIRKIRGLRESCPVIFLATLDNPQTMLDCLRAGGDDVLRKSSSVEEIAQRIRFWSRRGGYTDIGARRLRAIKELEQKCEART